MAFSITTRKVTISGDGSTDEFEFSFLFYDEEHIQVSVTDDVGEITVLDPSEFALALGDGSADEGWQGGSVTYPLSGQPLESDESITIERVLPYHQTLLDLSLTGTFDPRGLERAFDQFIMLVQQVRDTALGLDGDGADVVVENALTSGSTTNAPSVGATAAGIAAAVVGMLTTANLIDSDDFTGALATNMNSAEATKAYIDALVAALAPLVHTHVDTDISNSTSAGRALLIAADVAAQLVLLGLTGLETAAKMDNSPVAGSIPVFTGTGYTASAVSPVANAPVNFDTHAAGVSNAEYTPAAMFALNAAQEIPLTAGVAQITLSGATASTNLRLPMDTGENAAEIRITALSATDQKALIGHRFLIQIENIDGAAKTITFGAAGGDETLYKDANFAAPTIAASVGARAYIIFFIDADLNPVFTYSGTRNAL